MKLKIFFALVFATLALQANALTNIAQGKTATASTGTASLAVDGNDNTRWESTQGLDNQWLYVDLESKQTIDHLEIRWEGAYAKHFKIWVADELTDEMTAALNDDDTTNNFASGWTQATEYEGSMTGFPYEQTLTLTNVSARYVAIECIERGTVYGFSFWEFRVYDEAAEDPILSSIKITANKTTGATSDNFTLQVSTYDQNGKDYRLAAEENAAKEWICSGNATVNDITFKATTRGTYTVKCKIGEIESNEVTIDIVAEGENLAKGKTATSETGTAANAVDGLDTMWITDPSADGSYEYNAILVVDLGEVIPFNCIHLWWEGATSADYTITFSTDGETYTEPTATFTMTGGAGMTERNDWLSQNETINARYIKFHSTKASTQYGVKLRELEVYSNSAATLSAIAISSSKDCLPVGDTSFTFTAKGVDQFGKEFSIADILGMWSASGETMTDNTLAATEEGEYKVTYTANGITSNEVTVYVVDPANKVNLSVLDTTSATSVTTGETGDSTGANAAIDGNNGTLWGIAEPSGASDHIYDAELIIDLGGDTNIDCVSVTFEGANSCQYTLAGAPSSDKDNFSIFSSYDHPALLEARTDWHRGTTDKVRYVKLHSTKASTVYGVKIYEIAIYNKDGKTSSVNAVTEQGERISYRNGIVVLPQSAVAGEVYNATGTLVARTSATTIDLGGLNHGIYLVRATLADGAVVVAKIMR